MRTLVIDGKSLEKIDETDNLLLNMFSGLFPENLSKHECNLLKERYGKNWFYDLGYNDVEYKKPNCI